MPVLTIIGKIPKSALYKFFVALGAGDAQTNPAVRNKVRRN